MGVPMKFHDGVGGGGVMAGYHHHNLMDMYPGPAINTMDWKNTSQVSKNFKDFIQEKRIKSTNFLRLSVVHGKDKLPTDS